MVKQNSVPLHRVSAKRPVTGLYGPLRGIYYRDIVMTYRRNVGKPQKIRYNYDILKKGGRHTESHKKERRDAKREIDNEIIKEKDNDRK